MNAKFKKSYPIEFINFLNKNYEPIKIWKSYYPFGKVLYKLDIETFRIIKKKYDEEKNIWICSECNKEHVGKENANNCCNDDNKYFTHGEND